jgi:hypothetical protein
MCVRRWLASSSSFLATRIIGYLFIGGQCSSGSPTRYDARARFETDLDFTIMPASIHSPSHVRTVTTFNDSRFEETVCRHQTLGLCLRVMPWINTISSFAPPESGNQ